MVDNGCQWWLMLVEGSSVHVKSGSSVHVRRLVVCARFCCVILSLQLCNMILLLAFFKTSSQQLIKLCFFSSHLCVGLLFLCLYSLPSPPSPPELLLSLSTSLKLSHTMHTFHLTQLLSSHKSHNSSHTTHLTQLISHNSTLSRAAFVWHLVELLRVLSLNFTQVLSHNSSHNSHNSSHTTPLISQLTQLISRISAHLTTNTTHFNTQLLSSHKCKCSTASKMMRLLCVCRHRNMNLINSPHPTGN